jgi:hypothetical protein
VRDLATLSINDHRENRAIRERILHLAQDVDDLADQQELMLAR